MAVIATGPATASPSTMKSTEPAGVPFEPVMVAVNVTTAPGADGLGEAESAVEEVRFFQPGAPTACTNTPEITGGALALPRYRTAIACDPAVSAVVVNVADPDTMVDAPSSAAPS